MDSNETFRGCFGLVDFKTGIKLKYEFFFNLYYIMYYLYYQNMSIYFIVTLYDGLKIKLQFNSPKLLPIKTMPVTVTV